MYFFIHLITRSSGGSNKQFWNGDKILFWINSNHCYDIKYLHFLLVTKSQILLCFVIEGNAMLQLKISENKHAFFLSSLWSPGFVVQGFLSNMWALCRVPIVLSIAWPSSRLLQSVWYAAISLVLDGNQSFWPHKELEDTNKYIEGRCCLATMLRRI